MTRLLSILLLATFIFNLGGYYFLFKVLEIKGYEELVQRLDNDDYSSEQLLELKIPIALPYSNYLVSDFKRVNGMFEHDGEAYKLVKQKLESDTLYIIAIKDIERKKLKATFKEFAKQTHDVPLSQKKHTNQVIKQLQKEYDTLTHHATHNRIGSQITFDTSSGEFTPLLQYQDVPTPPPQIG